MHISFMTMNRFVEGRAASDEGYRQLLQQRGKVLLSHGRALSDDALLSKLRTRNVGLDKNQFLLQSQGFFSAEEMARAVYDDKGTPAEDQDWVWIAFACLWERWQRDRPSMEMIDDLMQQGYQARDHGDLPEVCRLWLAAWKGIWKIMEAAQLRSVEEFDARFPSTSSVFNWVQDLNRELHHAGLEDRSYWRERLALLETLVDQLHLKGLLLANCKKDLAETLFDLGKLDKGEQLYHQWLREKPQWGWGWIGWSDCYYRFARDRERDAGRAEEILKQGLAVPGVEDKTYLLDRLAGLYEETGRAEEARALRASSQPPERPAVTVPAKAEERQRQTQEPSGLGNKELPLGDVGKLLGSVRGASPRAAFQGVRIGRNEPCPCGSGKKFKRCCGKPTA